MKTTIRDIAERANVSISAVSLALNNKGGVSEETRELIFRIARELNYIRTTGDKYDQRTKKGILEFVKIVRHGHILNESHRVFIADYLEGITQTARSLGYDLQVKSETGADAAAIASDINSDAVNGAIILGTELTAADFEEFGSLTVPVLFLDTWHDFYQFDFVDMNNIDAVYRIMTHLYAFGHREIGFVNGSLETRNLKLREQGYLEMLKHLGLPVRQEFLFEVDTTFEGAYEDMKRLLSANPALPTALFVGNDIMSYGCMRALREAGYRIPEDISLVGFDDLPSSQMSDPPLTTVRVSKRQMGALAIDLLVKRIERAPKMAPVKVLVGGELVQRASVKRLN